MHLWQNTRKKQDYLRKTYFINIEFLCIKEMENYHYMIYISKYLQTNGVKTDIVDVLKHLFFGTNQKLHTQ